MEKKIIEVVDKSGSYVSEADKEAIKNSKKKQPKIKGTFVMSGESMKLDWFSGK